ncbi:hypothetical protein [Citrobacter braakii]|uniref:hypothetical protein n=1 Tax=Citrobacter braakii TaxID=57706 RepID=UPI00227054AD|nr:hypothetical protein [Citrobacter braakii]WAD30796.1 hypothetical protein MKJ05_21830 [Citrobacter braakii]
MSDEGTDVAPGGDDGAKYEEDDAADAILLAVRGTERAVRKWSSGFRQAKSHNGVVMKKYRDHVLRSLQKKNPMQKHGVRHLSEPHT